MTEFEKWVTINLRRFFRIVLGRKDRFEATYNYSDYLNQSASDLIYDGLMSSKPFAVSRFGHSELRALLTYLHIQENSTHWQKLTAFVKGEKVEPWWSEATIEKITHNAGVFPRNIETIENFSRLVLKDINDIDVLGSWLGGEHWIKSRMSNTKFIRFIDFYHFLHVSPWTLGLKDKKVLVVHPFVKSIENQFKIKDKIFSGNNILPDFDLITYRSIQSIAGNIPDNFDNWFQALDYMKNDISNIDFDVAILGCGAYGMPLAVYIKRDLKKKAIHLGGNVQILFGIKGSRWENDQKFNNIINPYWVKPLPEETPTGHKTIDDNCYW